MSAKNSSETNIDKGFVAILDVLGFGGLSEKEQSQVASILEQTIDRILPTFDSTMSDSVKGRMKAPFVRMFADTIIIAFPRESDGAVNQDMFHFVNNYLGLLFCLLLTHNVLIRGAVGYGTIVGGTYGIYGKAVNDAKKEYEATSWAGIHYTPAATSFIAKWQVWAVSNDVKDVRTLPGTAHNANQTQFFVARVPFKPLHKHESTIDPRLVSHRFTVPWPKDLRFVIEARDILLVEPKTAHTRAVEILSAGLDTCQDRVREIRNNTIGFLESYLGHFPDVNSAFEVRGPIPPLE